MAQQQKYQLKTGVDGEGQLDNLDYFFGKQSRAFLRGLGLKPDMKILDVGCGIGNLSCWLAEQVGTSGQVVAVDNDEQQLMVAKTRADARKLNNISFAQTDAYDLKQFSDQFDLVYCRSLLIHLHDPELAIQNMANAVRMNGFLACEAGDLASTFYYPSFPDFQFLCKQLISLLQKIGNDTNIPYNIFSICRRLPKFSFAVKMAQEVLYEAKEVSFLQKTFVCY